MLVNAEKSYEKTLDVNVDFSRQVLTVLKTVVIEHAESLPVNEKEQISDKITDFLSVKLDKDGVTIDNPKELSFFLLEHFSLIQPLISVCQHVRSELGEKAKLHLNLEIENYDESQYTHPVLYVKTEDMNREFRKRIRNLGVDFLEPFIEAGVTMGIRPDIL